MITHKIILRISFSLLLLLGVLKILHHNAIHMNIELLNFLLFDHLFLLY